MFEFVILLIGCTHGFYLSYAIYLKDNRFQSANGLLSMFVVSFSMLLLLVLLTGEKVIATTPHFIGLDHPIKFVVGPLLYLYTVKLTTNALTKTWWQHFILSGCVLVICLPFYFQSTEFKFEFINLFELEKPLAVFYALLFDWILILLPICQLLTYLYLISARLRYFRVNQKSANHHSPKQHLTWLYVLNWVMIIILVLWLFDESLRIISNFCGDTSQIQLCKMITTTEEFNLYFSEVGVVLCIYLISLYGLKQPHIFRSGKEIVSESQPLSKPTEKKYKHSVLTKSMAEDLYDDLCNTLTEQQLFLDPDLTLDKLVTDTGYSRHNLSQAINQCSGNNFNDFINNYRIDYAKNLLTSGASKSIQDIAIEAGFNSRTAFYSAFKKQLNMTPSDFKKQSMTNSQS